MDGRHVIGVLFVVLLIALAGCVIPSTTDTAPQLEESDLNESDLNESDEGEPAGTETNETGTETETNESETNDTERETESNETETETGSKTETNETETNSSDSDPNEREDTVPSDEDGDPEETTTHPEAETTAEADDVLPVDVYETYERVSEMLESDADQPEVEVQNMDETLEDAYEEQQDPFHEAMNMTETEVDTESARGMATLGSVVVDPNDGDRVDVEQVLVHEYAHTIQFAEMWSPDPPLETKIATSTDYRNVDTALTEGGAVWVTDQYSEIYQDDDVRLQSERLAAEYETAPDGDRYFRGPYHYGFQYADERLDEPTDFPELYEDPPTTTEQLLHGLDPDEAEPTDLAVDATVEDDGDTWTLRRDDRLGELFIRIALETELESDVAADAAAGWGNDRLVGFRHHDGDEWGFVWALHWDSSNDADAFEDAFETLLADRTDERTDEIVVDRRGEETVLVTVGSDAFRDVTTVTGSETDLEIRVG